MSHLHPAAVLAILLCLFLLLVMPLIAWFAILRGRDDTGTAAAHCWYGGLALTGAGALVVVLLQRASALTACCLTLAVALCIASMRLDLGRPLRRRGRLAVAWGVFALAASALDAAGLWLNWGALLFTSTMVGLQLYLVYLLDRVRVRRRSRGLWVVMAGVGWALGVNVVRALSMVLVSDAGSVFPLSALSIAAVAAVTISEVLMTLGYVVFSLEKAHQRHLEDMIYTARAQEQQRLAEQHAQALQAIVAQRDAMIVLNSRFTAVNSLAMYSSSIVHEISQPVQALTSILDVLGLQQPPPEPKVAQALERARQLTGRIGQTLTLLRQLISVQPLASGPVDVHETVQHILPILQGEAQRRGHRLDWAPTAPGVPLVVQADRVLLERILFNLVTNAFEALEGVGATGQARISTALRQAYLCRSVVISVEDNGPGLAPGLLAGGVSPFQSTKLNGVGLGLALARLLVETWRGQLQLHNLQATHGQPGTRIELILPLAPGTAGNAV